MTTDEEDEVRKDGLRYKSKMPGQQYSMMSATGRSMSCFRCGLHKPRSLGKMVRLIGANQFVCDECLAQKISKG